MDWSWQFPKDWWPWLLALAVYGLVRGLTDDCGFTPHEVWPIRADEWLAQLWGGHTVPTVSLQHRLCADHCAGYGRLRWYDYAASATTPRTSWPGSASPGCSGSATAASS